MSTILSIDPSGSPNGTTGVVLIGYDDTTPAHALASWAVQGGVEPFREWTDQYLIYEVGDYDGGVNRNGPSEIRHNLDTRWQEIDVIICEKFVPRNIPGADYTPLVMEGAIQWIWPDVIWSPASGKDRAVPDQVLKRLGLWWTGDHHGDRNEAARHAIRHIKNQQHKPTLLAGWSTATR